MTVINIRPDFATDVYPYTDTYDVYEMITDRIHQEIDSSLIFTVDIVDTWSAYGMPDPEEADGSITDQMTRAVYDVLYQESYDDEWCDSRDEYAAKLLDQLSAVSLIGWDEGASYTPEEVRVMLDGINELDMQEAHELLIECRDLINAVA